MKTANPLFNKEKLQKAIQVLDALDNPFREKLIKFMQNHPASTVTAIIKGVKKVQSFVSKHLRILRISNLISYKKIGKEVFYSINQDKIDETNKSVDMLVKS